MKTKLVSVTKRVLRWFLALFRHFYAIKENGEIIGYVGMDGTFISNEDKKDGDDWHRAGINQR